VLHTRSIPQSADHHSESKSSQSDYITISVFAGAEEKADEKQQRIIIFGSGTREGSATFADEDGRSRVGDEYSMSSPAGNPRLNVIIHADGSRLVISAVPSSVKRIYE